MENIKHKFSVIVGVYNHAKTLAKLAEALNQQTFQDFEVIYCDDGSTDTGKQIFEAKLHPIIKMRGRYRYVSQPNKGMRLAKSINNGLRIANSEYCVVIMGDSFPDPNYLAVMNEFVRPHRILCGVRWQIDRGVGVDADYRLKKKIIPPENVMLPNLPFNCITGNGLCIPTDAMKEHGYWDEDMEGYGGEDTEVVGRLYYKGYIVFSLVDAKLYHHWHKPSEPKNVRLVSKKVQAYSGIPL